MKFGLPKTQKVKLILITFVITMVIALAFANLRNPQKELSYKLDAVAATNTPHFKRVISELLGPPVVDGNNIRGLYNGEQIFPAMLKAIKSAQKTITFESYIYWSGEVGSQFVEALSERAQSGVKVHVLLDWVGSEKIDDAYIERMQKAGVEVERYHVLKWYNISRMNNRTHRKILVIDGKIGFTGGVGISDDWSGNGLDPKRWRDTHFEVEGPVVTQMQAAFMDNWLKTRPEVHQSPDYFPELEAKGQMPAQMFKSSSREGVSSVRIMYLLAIAAAKETIHLESAYFVPDSNTVAELVRARKRGVRVELIVPGSLTDAAIVRHASRDTWVDLLKAGVQIYEYQPAMFHCKVFIVDGHFVSIGSTNFDERSFRLNDEANLNILDSDFAAQQIKGFEIDKARSKLVTLEAWQNRPLMDRVFEVLTKPFQSQL